MSDILRPCSSATICISESTSSSGIAAVVDEFIVCSTYSERTSMSSNDRSNCSITFEIASTFIEPSTLSIPFVTIPIDRVTCCILIADSRRDATASTRLESRR